MWPELTRYLPTFKSAVVTALDVQGYPASVRCVPTIDQQQQVLRIGESGWHAWSPGPASLLCHDHDAQLWNQRSFLVRGTLARDGDGWRFTPSEFISGIGVGNRLVGLLHFVLRARRTAKRYLAVRSLSRPQIPWEAINRVKRQAMNTRRR